MALATTPEFDALVSICLGRGKFDSANPAVLPAGFNWEQFAALAARHRVEAIVWHKLAVSSDVPENTAATLRRVRREQSLNFLAQLAETARLCRLLEQAGCPVIALKGCTLAMTLHARSPEIRHSIDIDLLVAPADFAAADAILRGDGFRRQRPGAAIPPAADSMARYLLNAYEYAHPESGHKVELHHRLTASPHDFCASFEDLVAASQSHSIGGVEVRCLGQADLFVYLCCHAAGHLFFRLKWLVDIALLFDRSGNDGPRGVLRRARRLGCERPVLLSFKLLSRLSGRECDSARSSGDFDFARLEARAIAALTNPARDGGSFQFSDVRDDLTELIYGIRLASDWRSKRFKILQHLTNHRDLVTLGLGSKWATLYGLLGRPLALSRWLSRVRANHDGAAGATELRRRSD